MVSPKPRKPPKRATTFSDLAVRAQEHVLDRGDRLLVVGKDVGADQRIGRDRRDVDLAPALLQQRAGDWRGRVLAIVSAGAQRVGPWCRRYRLGRGHGVGRGSAAISSAGVPCGRGSAMVSAGVPVPDLGLPAGAISFWTRWGLVVRLGRLRPVAISLHRGRRRSPSAAGALHASADGDGGRCEKGLSIGTPPLLRHGAAAAWPRATARCQTSQRTGLGRRRVPLVERPGLERPACEQGLGGVRLLDEGTARSCSGRLGGVVEAAGEDHRMPRPTRRDARASQRCARSAGRDRGVDGCAAARISSASSRVLATRTCLRAERQQHLLGVDRDQRIVLEQEDAQVLQCGQVVSIDGGVP